MESTDLFLDFGEPTPPKPQKKKGKGKVSSTAKKLESKDLQNTEETDDAICQPAKNKHTSEEAPSKKASTQVLASLYVS